MKYFKLIANNEHRKFKVRLRAKCSFCNRACKSYLNGKPLCGKHNLIERNKLILGKGYARWMKK